MAVKGFCAVLVGAALVCLGSLGCTSLQGRPGAGTGDGPGQVLHVQKIVLVDAQGRGRGSLGVDGDCVSLVLKDAEGRPRLSVGSPSPADPKNPYWCVRFTDAKGQERMLLAMHNSGAGSGVSLHDAEGDSRIELGEGPDGGGFALHDAEGVTRASIGVGADGGAFGLFDAKGVQRAGMGLGPDGCGITVMDQAGHARAGVEVANNGWASVRVLDEAGHDRASLTSTEDMGIIAVRDPAGHERATMATGAEWSVIKVLDKDGKQTWSADQDGGH